LGQSEMKWVVSPHSKQPLGDLLLSLRNLCRVRNFLVELPRGPDVDVSKR
jgi:hypothetical protein